MLRVIIESPYAGSTRAECVRNVSYLRACMHDALVNHWEAPFASHGLYTQPGVLDDGDPDEREHGIQAGFAWRSIADRTAVYNDLGITKGMQYGINHAQLNNREIVYRQLGSDWETTHRERQLQRIMTKLVVHRTETDGRGAQRADVEGKLPSGMPVIARAHSFDEPLSMTFEQRIERAKRKVAAMVLDQVVWP